MHSPEGKLVLFTFFLFVVTGGGVIVTLISGHPPKSTTSVPARAPASQLELSLSSKSEPQQQPTPNIATMTIGCLKPKNSRQLPWRTQQIRFTGELCASKKLTKTTIVNQTNNTKATVFQTGPKTYSSDLLDLNEGRNRIHIKHQFSSPGQDRETIQLTIHRKPAGG